MRSKKLVSKDDTALLVVDIQEKLAAAMPQDILGKILKNTIKLLKAARELRLPVYVTEQYPKGLGKTLPEIAAETGGTRTFEKMTFSSGQVEGIIDDLKKRNVKNVIISGMETHVCVAQTALDLVELGFCVTLPADGCCSQRKDDWRFALERLRSAGVTVYGWVTGEIEDALSALLQGDLDAEATDQGGRRRCRRFLGDESARTGPPSPGQGMRGRRGHGGQRGGGRRRGSDGP